MKHLIILLFCFSLLRPIIAQNDTVKTTPTTEEKIEWISISEAFARNKNYPKKKIIVDFFTDWCGWCKRMDAATYTHPQIIKYINANFWAVKFDAETKDTIKIDNTVYTNPNPSMKRSVHPLAANLLNNKMSYPTTLFLNESNNPITTVPGYFGPKDFEVVLKYIGNNEYLKMTYDQFRNQFVGEIKD